MLPSMSSYFLGLQDSISEIQFRDMFMIVCCYFPDWTDLDSPWPNEQLDINILIVFWHTLMCIAKTKNLLMLDNNVMD